MTEPGPSRPPLDLQRPRDLGALLVDGFRLYLREFRTFVLIALAVVVPVQLIVGGIGLGQFTAAYDDTPAVEQSAIQFASSFFIVAPLTTAMCIAALLDSADGRKPNARSAIQRGLDVFAPLLLVVLLYAAGVVAGLLLLILPGIYLAIRWSLFIPAAVIDGRRGVDALERSAELVRGSWFRVALIIVAVNFVVGGLSALVGVPFLALANSTGDAVFQLIGQIAGGVLFSPPAALIIALLFFDRKTRAAE